MCSQSAYMHLGLLVPFSFRLRLISSFFVACPEHMAVSLCSSDVCGLSTYLCVCTHVPVLFHWSVSSSATEHTFYFLICNCRKSAMETELSFFSFSLVLYAISPWSLLPCLQTEQKKAERLSTTVQKVMRTWSREKQIQVLSRSKSITGQTLLYTHLCLTESIVPGKVMTRAEA